MAAGPAAPSSAWELSACGRLSSRIYCLQVTWMGHPPPLDFGVPGHEKKGRNDHDSSFALSQGKHPTGAPYASWPLPAHKGLAVCDPCTQCGPPSGDVGPCGSPKTPRPLEGSVSRLLTHASSRQEGTAKQHRAVGTRWGPSVGAREQGSIWRHRECPSPGRGRGQQPSPPPLPPGPYHMAASTCSGSPPASHQRLKIGRSERQQDQAGSPEQEQGPEQAQTSAALRVLAACGGGRTGGRG